MQTKAITRSSLVGLVTRLNNVAAHPTTDAVPNTLADIVFDKRVNASFDTPICFWQSQAVEAAWAITIPQYNGASVSRIKDDFWGSLSANSACRGPYRMNGTQPVRKRPRLFCGSTHPISVPIPRFIKATTGNRQATAYRSIHQIADFGTNPDASNAIYEIMEGGESDPADIFRRDALSAIMLMAANVTATPTDAEMIKLLKLSLEATHKEIVKVLSGPSVLDHNI